MNTRFGGHRHSRSSKRKIAKAMKKNGSKTSAWMRRYWRELRKNPKEYQRILTCCSVNSKKGWTPERHKQHQRELKRRAHDPKFIKTRIKSLQTKSHRLKQSLNMKRRWEDPEFRKSMLCVIRKVVSSQTSGVQMFIFRSLRSRGYKGIRLNFPVSGKFADIAFPKQKVAIELDGWLHKDRKESDRRRDRLFKSLGWRVRRFPACRKSLGQIPKYLERAL